MCHTAPNLRADSPQLERGLTPKSSALNVCGDRNLSGWSKRCGGCGYLGPRPTTEHAAASRSRKARERGFRVDFRPCVFVAANQRRRFVPRDGCRIEVAASRRVRARAAKARALSRHAESEAERPKDPRPPQRFMQEKRASSSATAVRRRRMKIECFQPARHPALACSDSSHLRIHSAKM